VWKSKRRIDGVLEERPKRTKRRIEDLLEEITTKNESTECLIINAQRDFFLSKDGTQGGLVYLPLVQRSGTRLFQDQGH
jgi:hypothetical protein